MSKAIKIGDARLVHGDCLAFMETLAPGSVDLILTDPPYGNNNNNNGDLISRREAALGRAPADQTKMVPRPIDNDGSEAEELFRQMTSQTARILKPGRCYCCCGGGGGPDPQFARWSLIMNEKLLFKQMIVWDKGPMGMGWHYRRSYETILVAQKKGAKCAWFDDSHKIENIIRPGMYGIKKIIPSKSQHPTQKPVELAELFIRLHSQPGDLVFDPFMGSGTTGVAALKLGRRFIGCETNKEFFEMARGRVRS